MSPLTIPGSPSAISSVRLGYFYHNIHEYSNAFDPSKVIDFAF